MLEHKVVDHILILKPTSLRIDIFTSSYIRKELLELVELKSLDNVILDLSAVEFIDSSGLVTFLALWKVLRKRDGDLKLACLHDMVNETLNLVQLNRVFAVHTTVKEALAAYHMNATKA